MKIFTADEWNHFCSTINWKKSWLDAEAITIMNKPDVKLSDFIGIIANLESDYDYGGGENRDGGLEPGHPDWEEAFNQLKELLK